MDNSELIRNLRLRHSLSRRDLGRVLGLSARTIEGLEQGRRRDDDRVLTLALRNLTWHDIDEVLGDG